MRHSFSRGPRTLSQAATGNFRMRFEEGPWRHNCRVAPGILAPCSAHFPVISFMQACQGAAICTVLHLDLMLRYCRHVFQRGLGSDRRCAAAHRSAHWGLPPFLILTLNICRHRIWRALCSCMILLACFCIICIAWYCKHTNPKTSQATS